MQIRKVEKVVTEVDLLIDEILCDHCGKLLSRSHKPNIRENLGEKFFEVNLNVLEYDEHGVKTGDRDFYSVDLCGKCMEEFKKNYLAEYIKEEEETENERSGNER